MTPAEEAVFADKLRADLKTHGLEHAVRLMSVPERGEARRCIRNALGVYALSLIGGAAVVPPLNRGSTALREALAESVTERNQPWDAGKEAVEEDK